MGVVPSRRRVARCIVSVLPKPASRATAIDGRGRRPEQSARILDTDHLHVVDRRDAELGPEHAPELTI
jgi:hypothetical protein